MSWGPCSKVMYMFRLYCHITNPNWHLCGSASRCRRSSNSAGAAVTCWVCSEIQDCSTQPSTHILLKEYRQKSSSSKTEVGDKWTALLTGLSSFVEVACHALWWGHLTAMQLPQGLHPRPPGSGFFHFPPNAPAGDGRLPRDQKETSGAACRLGEISLSKG